MAFKKKITTSLLAVCALYAIFFDQTVDVRRFLRSAADVSTPAKRTSVAKYSQNEIEATAPHLEVFHPRLLVWSEEEDFQVYNLDHEDSRLQDKPACGRCAKIVPLLVHALKSQFPDRFQQGQPVFQMLWSDADSFQSVCVNKDAGCQTEKFAPMPFFGSVPKDPSVLPTIKAFPNWFYINCLYNWKFGVDQSSDCWEEEIDEDISWDELIPKVIWRGSDFTFLPTSHAFIPPKHMMDFVDGFGDEKMTPEAILMHLFHRWDDLSPRWKAVILSSQAELNNQTWLDAKYVGPMRANIHAAFASKGVPVETDQHMNAVEMSRYKYQIDLGGGGGTTWRGTLSKLAMPGLLFHHETPTKDWFHDLMKPFQHYIPIRLDLADLKGKYDWAEASQDRAHEISAEGKVLAKHIFSPGYMASLYDDLFVDYAGKVVESYVALNATWSECHQRYTEHGFTLTKVAYCRVSRCFTNVRDDVFRAFPHFIPNLDPSPSVQPDADNVQQGKELERSLSSDAQSPQHISTETQEVKAAPTLGSPKIPLAALVLESPEVPQSPTANSTETEVVSSALVAERPEILDAALILEGPEVPRSPPDSSTDAQVVAESPETPDAALVLESAELPQSPTGASTEIEVVSSALVAENSEIPGAVLALEGPEASQSPLDNSIETLEESSALVAESPEASQSLLVSSSETQDVSSVQVVENPEVPQSPLVDSTETHLVNTTQVSGSVVILQSSR